LSALELLEPQRAGEALDMVFEPSEEARLVETMGGANGAGAAPVQL
jgi:hypothetical protein